MIFNFLKITIRNFWRYRGFSFINISGLTIGLICSILIFLYVRDELSYDKFHDNYENIYRVKVEALIQGNEMHVVHTGAGVGQVFVDGIPEVVQSTRLIKGVNNANFIVRYEDKMYSESKVYYADSCFFDVFSFKMIQGDPATALDNPRSIVLTKSHARKYFGDEDPMDKTIQIDSRGEYKITGITEDCPANSHFHYDILISYASHWVSRQTTWINNDFTYTYLVLEDATLESVFLEKSKPIIYEHLAPEVELAFGASLEDVLAAGNKYAMRLQPIKDIHLTSHTDFEMEINSSKIYVYFFSIIALFILVLAAINFTNLSTARSAIRAKEVGIRKVVGSSKGRLVFQFLFESIVYSLLSLILAMLIIEAILPFFNNLAMKDIHINYMDNPRFILFLLLLGVLLGLFSGIYSAVYLSSIKVLNIIKGQILSSGKSRFLRNGLVIFQFVISIILFISTIIIRSQLVYIQEKDLGFEKDNVVVLEGMWKLRQNKQAFKDELYSDASISSISMVETMPGRKFNGFFLPVPEKEGVTLNPRVLGLEHDFIETFKAKMIMGRFFSEEFPSDTMAAVINESLAKELGLDNPIGKQFRQNDMVYTIIGVIKNFSFSSLHKEVGSLLMIHSHWRYQAYCAIRVSNSDLQQSIDHISEVWSKFVPDSPMEYYFLDEDFVNLHKEEFVTGKLFTYFSILSIVIACLGLLGLSAFVAEKKSKEIGIRKANGASFGNIVNLLIRSFSTPVLLANIIAWPAGFFLMQKWLQKFAFHIDVNIWPFIVATLLALAIAWITVLYQAVKSARQNPVDSLRYE